MNKNQLPLELREAEDIPPPTNHWFILRMMGFLLMMIPIVLWISQEAMGYKPSHHELIYLFLAGSVCDVIFKLKNHRRILFLYNPKK